MKNDNAIAALSALAHADRLAAFRLVLRSGKDGLPSGRIAEALGIQPTRMSFHLSTLEKSGVLYSERDGRHIRYAVNFPVMRGLLGFLTEECCAGHPEICADLMDGGKSNKKLEEIS
ncbi:transcriptional regulator [Thalassospiraceae bacterium LMO-JJ14]|nr:transcriptional regulator [Thalassospiraceae bacterium LMO-JJ14]